MEEGSLRCEPNISLRPKGSEELGTRTEIKNKNSFQDLLVAMEYEVKRQARILDRGGEVVQETLLFDANTGKTVAMRGKEEADDYRYFPEPDLVHVHIDDEWIEKIKKELPKRPFDRRQRFLEKYGISSADAEKYGISPADAVFLTRTRQLADFFNKTVQCFPEEKRKVKAMVCANWIMGDLTRLLNAAGIEIQDSKVKPEHLKELIALLEGIEIQDSKVKPEHLKELILFLLEKGWEGKKVSISGKNAKVALEIAFKTGDRLREIAHEQDLLQEDNPQMEEQAVLKVIEEYKDGAVKDYLNGKQEAIGFLMGQVMKATRGKANPQRVNKLLREKLSP